MSERRTKLRRPAQLPRTSKLVAPKSRGTTGTVPPGTRGIYDRDPNVRTATARAMLARRRYVEVTCEAEGCVDPSTGQPVVFLSRLVNGRPERRGHSSAHRLRIWRQEMRDRGYKQAMVNGEVGWVTPDGTFYPNPSQSRKQRTLRRVLPNRRIRRVKRAEVTPESG